MVAKIIDGNIVAKKVKNNIMLQVQQRLNTNKRAPGLAVILVGNNSSSKIYISSKKKACKDVGITLLYYELPDTVSEIDLLYLIDSLNERESIDGVLVQLPLPVHINNFNILERISPYKDVDGLHPYNIGRLSQRIPLFRPCTPRGIITLLKHYSINISGLNAVIVGASNIVGKPMSMELLIAGCTVTITHSFTKDLWHYVKDAELLIVAAGKPNLIPGHWIKSGAVVIDVGINRLNNGKIVGDVEFIGALNHAAFITPVPGGVGPMTVASLIENTFQACEKHT